MRNISTVMGSALLALGVALTLRVTDMRAEAPQTPAQTGTAPQTGAAPAPGRTAARPVVDAPAPKKHVLVLAFANGWHHGSITDAAATIWQMGNESGLFDTEIRSDTKWITKGSAGSGESRNLDWFDAIVAVNTTGAWLLEDEQKQDFLSFIRDDGKGFVGVHAALDANRGTIWPEYLEMIGGQFASHPWNTFAAPVIIEDPAFPAMRHFTSTQLTLYDEMYMSREPYDRSKVNVLMRLDESKLPPVPGRAGEAPAAGGRGSLREDRDFAIAWAKTYGKGRVFYSSLGHTKASWTNPDVRKMYLEAIKWSLGLTEGSTASHQRR